MTYILMPSPPLTDITMGEVFMAYLSRRLSARAPFMLSASLAVVAIATPALAQNDTATATTSNAGPASAAPNDAAADSNEIVVTAQFRAQNIQDTPHAITAVP